MRFNKKMFAGLMVAITMLWVVNIIYYDSRKIEKPIFFRHLLETSLENSFTINYIEDVESEGEIKYIKIPELGDEPLYINGSNSSVVYSDKHYNYCTLFIDLKVHYGTYNEKTKEYISKIKGDKVFAKILYGTASGQEYIEDIGRIYITDNKHKDISKSLKESGMVDGILEREKLFKISAYYKADKGVKFTGYGGEFKKEVEDLFDIKVNGKNIKDMKLPMDSNNFNIQATEKKRSHKNIPEFYSIPLRLYFENSKGEQEVVPFYVYNKRVLSMYGDVEKKEVDNLIKIRRENK